MRVKPPKTLKHDVTIPVNSNSYIQENTLNRGRIFLCNLFVLIWGGEWPYSLRIARLAISGQEPSFTCLVGETTVGSTSAVFSSPVHVWGSSAGSFLERRPVIEPIARPAREFRKKMRAPWKTEKYHFEILKKSMKKILCLFLNIFVDLCKRT